jgi:hypothetical protein
LKNVQFVIANEEKQSHKPLIIKETATAHMRLAMTGSAFFKALIDQIMETFRLEYPMDPSRNKADFDREVEQETEGG